MCVSEKRYPPIAYIGRGGATNFALLISCPIHFSCTVLADRRGNLFIGRAIAK